MSIEHVWAEHFRRAQREIAVISRPFLPGQMQDPRRSWFQGLLFTARQIGSLPATDRKWLILSDPTSEEVPHGKLLQDFLRGMGWEVRIASGTLPYEWLRIDEHDHFISTLDHDQTARVPDSEGECDRVFESLWLQTTGARFEALKPDLLDTPRLSSLTVADWSDVIRQLALVPEDLHQLAPRRFEEIVAELLHRDGYEVHVTPASNDGGRDILARMSLPTGPLLVLVECKRYAPERAIGVEVVRSLYGVVEAERATSGLIVTTSRFTKGAIGFSSNTRFRLSLRDYTDLKRWLLKASR